MKHVQTETRRVAAKKISFVVLVTDWTTCTLADSLSSCLYVKYCLITLASVGIEMKIT